MAAVTLGIDEDPDGHPGAQTWLYRADLGLLAYLLQDLRALVRRHVHGHIELENYQTLSWEVHGLQRRTVVCDPATLCERRDFHVVGFLGGRRIDADAIAIEDIEIELLAEFRNYPGIVSYSSVELADRQWVNLVVHTADGDRNAWRGSVAHGHAVDSIAPMAYHHVRIHNGCIAGGVIGSEPIVLESTKYWDYDCDPVWHATRQLPGRQILVLDDADAESIPSPPDDLPESIAPPTA